MTCIICASERESTASWVGVFHPEDLVSSSTFCHAAACFEALVVLPIIPSVTFIHTNCPWNLAQPGECVKTHKNKKSLWNVSTVTIWIPNTQNPNIWLFWHFFCSVCKWSDHMIRRTIWILDIWRQQNRLFCPVFRPPFENWTRLVPYSDDYCRMNHFSQKIVGKISLIFRRFFLLSRHIITQSFAHPLNIFFRNFTFERT